LLVFPRGQYHEIWLVKLSIALKMPGQMFLVVIASGGVMQQKSRPDIRAA
jgi:hypothetical protein